MLSFPCLSVSFLEPLLISVSCPICITYRTKKKFSIGPLYYIYMSLLSNFATNSINILAGINGSEVGQALIIALSVILNDLLYLPWPIDFRIPLHLLGNKAELDFGGVWNAGMAFGSRQLVERHVFSLYFMLPLVAVCTGFMYHNWYVNNLTQLQKKNLRVEYVLILGILHECFLETLYVMLREWPLLLLEFKLISRRRCCCSLCLKSSISFCLVHKYLGLFHVHGTGCQGWLDIIYIYSS